MTVIANPDETDSTPSARSPWWQGFLPRSARQRWVAVVALLFLAGCLGYLIGSESSRPPASRVDVGFLQDMVIHHQQAVLMATIATGRAEDPVVRIFANEILILQNREIGLMGALLDQRGRANRYDDDRPAMDWMDTPVPTELMPGMASEQQLDQLKAASGRDFDMLFLQLMRAHHLGGVEMASYAAENAAGGDVRKLAARIALYQRLEVNEFDQALQRLGAG